MRAVTHLYRFVKCGVSSAVKNAFLSRISKLLQNLNSDVKITDIELEYCFNIEIVDGKSELPSDELKKLLWLVTETFEPDLVSAKSFFTIENVIEVGPRLAFSTAWSSNCLSMCQACGVVSMNRIERSRRYRLVSSAPITESVLIAISSLLYDRMTECYYKEQLTTFDNGILPETVQTVPLLSGGRAALEKINREKGLGFDDWDLDFYTSMFTETMKRDPTDVECFDLGQSNSEHSRHWFFGGKMVIDGEEKKETLFSMVKATLPKVSNSIIAFHDNSSAIEGFPCTTLTPSDPSTASAMAPNDLIFHPILTAETHNFPSGVAPFPGAETGTGGRLRDVMATGRGAHSVAGISAYCVGNLNIPTMPLAWESAPAPSYSSSLATPLDIIIDASNGASDYGNKYGEPVISGFCRSFGQRLPNGERIEWIKPIMFTAGVGLMDSRHAVKGEPEVGMIVCKVGGPAYRIGMGGGAASSRVQSSSASEVSLDFNAVQRGDAEMENRLNRVIRGCIECGDNNPIISIHDQGAGGNGNVLKEIVDPHGARYELRAIPVGDPTMSVMEIWGAEYQENNAFLVKPESLELVMRLSRRENCPVSAIGTVTGDGRVVVFDRTDSSTPFNMPLSLVLGKMPQKCFEFTSPPWGANSRPLQLPVGTTVTSALDRVLRLVDVGSKRFLTNKVDRSVTGLVAQQQCVGPLHTPLSDVAVIAQSHFSKVGVAVSVGEQPIKGLLDNAAQARMTVGEALTNLVWAKITALSDVKASGNWMWAAKMEGEGSKMWTACEALRDALLVLGPGIDGGKDSLSMAARVDDGETVKAPGQVTMTCYASCTDITKTVTPDFKCPGRSEILYVDLGSGHHRTGGTALSTVFGQLGEASPDVSDLPLLRRAFEAVQVLLEARLLEAGHDRSDGGLLVTVLEMAFAGNAGFEVSLAAANCDVLAQLFSEELGLLLEVLPHNRERVMQVLAQNDVPCVVIGTVTELKRVVVRVGGECVLDGDLCDLRMAWESTSFELESRQCNAACVAQERAGLNARKGPTYKVTFGALPPIRLVRDATHKVAILRQEGSNGDREMLAAFAAAGMQAWDVNMRDLLDGSVSLDAFRGIVFCGGFSYADVNDSAKGWAGVIRFNERLLAQFAHFRSTRSDTFSLGVCNGCQLMALLGWVPFDSVAEEAQQPRFVHNTSGRFESRWSAVQIQRSPAVLLRGMEGSTLGVWVAHGEGKAYFPEPSDLQRAVDAGLAPVRYVDDDNNIATEYPLNPNGSPLGIAGLCSADGRHLAMMPHPERCFQTWQWPHKPSAWREALVAGEEAAGPWLKMFVNAREFCDSTYK